MKNGQGSLEYLAIAAAVLAIGVVAVLFLVSAGGTGMAAGDLSSCRVALAQILNDQRSFGTVPSESVAECEDSCAAYGTHYCSGACLDADVLNEFAETGSMPAASGCARAPVCGDGLQEGREECDDGNRESDDGCSPGCQLYAPWPCDTSSTEECDTDRLYNCPEDC